MSGNAKYTVTARVHMHVPGWVGGVVVYPGRQLPTTGDGVWHSVSLRPALAVPGYPGWVSHLPFAPFQPQDPARPSPSFQLVRVHIHEWGGSAKPLLRHPPLAKYQNYPVLFNTLEDLTPRPGLAGYLRLSARKLVNKALLPHHQLV